MDASAASASRGPAASKRPLMIDPKEIDLKEELGTGEFGSVLRGEWRRVCAVALHRLDLIILLCS